jgi:pimeloyl-ACP methyl ester carboxylesterase
MQAALTKAGTDIRSLTVHANRIRQHYLEAGSGPPVVLLHGFPETSYAWRHQIPALATHYRVIAPDLRGYSTPIRTPADAQSMVSAVTSRGAATTSPATGTTFTAALVTRTGAATTPQPARLAAAARISITPSRRRGRVRSVKGFILPSTLVTSE